MTWRETMIGKFGDEAGIKAEMRRRRLLVKKPTGFALLSKKKHLEVSKRGGQVGKQTQKSR